MNSTKEAGGSQSLLVVEAGLRIISNYNLQRQDVSKGFLPIQKKTL